MIIMLMKSKFVKKKKKKKHQFDIKELSKLEAVKN